MIMVKFNIVCVVVWNYGFEKVWWKKRRIEIFDSDIVII